TVERFIMHQSQTIAQTDDNLADNVQIVSKETVPDFFDSLGIEDAWDRLDSAQRNLANDL
ncbi:hypothetical protein HDV02_000351, partial [Globomyces sp. JEL0801]